MPDYVVPPISPPTTLQELKITDGSTPGIVGVSAALIASITDPNARAAIAQLQQILGQLNFVTCPP